jgi:hypothetical protein
MSPEKVFDWKKFGRAYMTLYWNPRKIPDIRRQFLLPFFKPDQLDID